MEEAGDSRTQALRGSDLALLLLGAGQHAVSQLSTSADSHLIDSFLTISRIAESRLLTANIIACARATRLGDAAMRRRRRRRRARC